MFKKKLGGAIQWNYVKNIKSSKRKLGKTARKLVNRLGTLVVCDVAWSLLQQDEKWDKFGAVCFGTFAP